MRSVVRSSQRIRPPSLGFGLRPPSLALEPPALGPLGRSGRTPNRRRRDTVAQKFSKPIPCGNPVLALRPLLAGTDDEHGSCEPRRETFEHTGALHIAQGTRQGEVDTQLHTGIGSVHSLPSRTGRTGELFDEVGCGHDETPGRTWPRQHAQVFHVSSVPHPPIRAASHVNPLDATPMRRLASAACSIAAARREM